MQLRTSHFIPVEHPDHVGVWNTTSLFPFADKVVMW